MPRTRILDWVRRSARAVTEYYDGFPVRKVDVKIAPIDEGKGVLFGRTVFVRQTLIIRVGLSRFATDSSLRDDVHRSDSFLQDVHDADRAETDHGHKPDPRIRGRVNFSVQRLRPSTGKARRCRYHTESI